MSGRKRDLAGATFGRLTVIGRAEPRRFWLCKCACGTLKNIRHDHLVDGRVRSCGCLGRESTGQRSLTHGHTRQRTLTPEYESWASMLSRCRNPNATQYKWYGGKGIKVCDRWQSFENFLADMGTRPEGTSLDRIDPYGNYEPSNCRWADRLEQRRNQRPQEVWRGRPVKRLANTSI